MALKFRTTVRDLMEQNLWDAYCKATEQNPRGVEDGLISEDSEIEMSTATAQGLGLAYTPPPVPDPRDAQIAALTAQRDELAAALRDLGVYAAALEMMLDRPAEGKPLAQARAALAKVEEG